MTDIYYHPLSFPSFGPIFTAEFIGISYTKHLVDLTKGEQGTETYRAINPFGKVPAIKDGAFNLAESAAIMRYLAQREKSSLYPEGLEAQAQIDQWMDFVNHHIRTPIARIQFNRVLAPRFGQEPDEQSIKLGLHLLESNMPHLETRLSVSLFLCGANMSLADIALTAALEPIDMAQIDISPYPKLSAWLKARRSEDFYTHVHSHFGAEMET